MKVMTQKESKMIDNLNRLANGDSNLVFEAFGAVAKLHDDSNEPYCELKDIIKYIEANRK